MCVRHLLSSKNHNAKPIQRYQIKLNLQLFMVPEFREGVLNFRDSEMPSEDSLMWQLQNMFSHLQVRFCRMVDESDVEGRQGMSHFRGYSCPPPQYFVLHHRHKMETLRVGKVSYEYLSLVSSATPALVVEEKGTASFFVCLFLFSFSPALSCVTLRSRRRLISTLKAWCARCGTGRDILWT